MVEGLVQGPGPNDAKVCLSWSLDLLVRKLSNRSLLFCYCLNRGQWKRESE